MKNIDADSDVQLEAIQPLRNPLTLEATAYLELRRLISEGVLLPGARIAVSALARRLGISRLPAIHALRRLASEGFVQIRPHKDVVVSKPTTKEMRGQFLVFASLEEVAIREAWPLSSEQRARLDHCYQRLTGELKSGSVGEPADYAFHDVLWGAAGIEYLSTNIQTLWNLHAYYRMLVYKKYGPNMRYRATEHAAILHAVTNGTLEEAVDHIRRHRLNSLERVTEVMTEILGSPVG
ncbi:MAG TPA: GntR family transcriptional regulator [Chloroflexota bacterium]|jgi:DNA-binding GntR family transcriptional regulator|nr:GntR family transcriptional regulator [Chloroflexota bacterium]